MTAINKALTDPISETWSIGLQTSNYRISPAKGFGERWSSDLLLEGAFEGCENVSHVRKLVNQPVSNCKDVRATSCQAAENRCLGGFQIDHA